MLRCRALAGLVSHSPRSYDVEQTNRSSYWLWGAGFPSDEPSLAH
ncbi:hypothetical protein [Desulfosporosinus sp.]|nr:hypothetical protein [Desulfosporosinus sp.]